MKILFFVNNNGKSPAKDLICSLDAKDKAKVLACFKTIEDLGFNSSRVEFRQIKDRLWEVKIRLLNSGFRIFYIQLFGGNLILLHGYKKKSQKAPLKELRIAEQRMKEVLENEKNNS